MPSGPGRGTKPPPGLPSPRSQGCSRTPAGAGSTLPPGAVDVEAVDVEGEEGDDVRQDGQGDRQAQTGGQAHVPHDSLDEGGHEVDVAWWDGCGPEGVPRGGPGPPTASLSTAPDTPGNYDDRLRRWPSLGRAASPAQQDSHTQDMGRAGSRDPGDSTRPGVHHPPQPGLVSLGVQASGPKSGVTGAGGGSPEARRPPASTH